MELVGHQDNPATQQKLRRLLKSVLSLPVRADDPLLVDAQDQRKKMDELIRRRLLPAARIGKVKETTLEMLAQMLHSPSLDKVREFNDQLIKGYDDVEEATVRRQISRLRMSPAGLLFEPLAKALLLGFIISLGAAYLWAIALGHSDLVLYLNTNPTFATAIFSFAAVLTVGFFSYFKRK